jgi:hypothetical protein
MWSNVIVHYSGWEFNHHPLLGPRKNVLGKNKKELPYTQIRY